MRIGIGGISHETNSFSNVATSEAVFRKYNYREGAAVLVSGVRTCMGGYTDEATAQGVELVPSLFANANPSGRIPTETLAAIRDKIVDSLWAQHQLNPLDGIVFEFHGAGASVGWHDVEGEVLRYARELFGKDIPIGICLDLHGNISPEMLEYSDVLIGVKCYPHVDWYETAQLVLKQVLDIIRTGKKPFKRLVQLPWLLVPACGVTLQGPAYDVQQLTIRLEEDPAIHSVTFFHGFPYSDIPQAGVSVTALGQTQADADRAALEVATYAWNRRRDFAVKALSPAQALDLAEKEPEGPIVINESSDNPGGGSPGDGTFLLRELLKRNLPGSAFGHITDPEVARQAAQAGVGGHISCILGGKTDKLHGEPIVLEDAYVRNISDGVYVNLSPMGKGTISRMGLSVLLQVGNVEIVVTSVTRQTMDCRPFEMVGINYQERRILCLKSSQHFRGWWQERAAAIIPCDPPGIHSGDLTAFDFQYANTSYYPLADAQWEP